jgi:hypothetical protein
MYVRVLVIVPVEYSMVVRRCFVVVSSFCSPLSSPPPAGVISIMIIIVGDMKKFLTVSY